MVAPALTALVMHGERRPRATTSNKATALTPTTPRTESGAVRATATSLFMHAAQTAPSRAHRKGRPRATIPDKPMGPMTKTPTTESKAVCAHGACLPDPRYGTPSNHPGQAHAFRRHRHPENRKGCLCACSIFCSPQTQHPSPTISDTPMVRTWATPRIKAEAVCARRASQFRARIKEGCPNATTPDQLTDLLTTRNGQHIYRKRPCACDMCHSIEI